jgi:hypothetical protein
MDSSVVEFLSRVRPEVPPPNRIEIERIEEAL